MSFGKFFKDALLPVAVWTCGVLLSCFVLTVAGAPVSIVVVAVGVSFIFGMLGIVIEYARRRRFLRQLERAAEELESPAWVQEMVQCPTYAEGELEYEVLRRVGKAACDEVAEGRRQTDDYRDYIESWVHEAKLPLAAAHLILENLDGSEDDLSRVDDLGRELARVERYIDQALYYARSEVVERDYLIRRWDLKTLVTGAIKANARELIAAHVAPVCENLDFEVFTDEKWLEFILGQLIQNSIKYAREDGAKIVFSGALLDEGLASERIELTVADNGCGVSAADLPRVFEKVYNAASHKAGAGWKGRLFVKAAEAARVWSRKEQAGEQHTFAEIAERAKYETLVYRTVRGALGPKIKYVACGGAPLSLDLAHFYNGIGLPMIQGYGMTETAAPFAATRVTDNVIGTVGQPAPGSSIRLSDEGELQVKGPNVFRGYHNLPEKTAEAFTADGWLRTGDLAEIDDEGHIVITGRIKDIIITAGGKNVSPIPLEEEIAKCPIVEHCVVVGDQRPFIGALVTLDPESLALWLPAHGLSTETPVDRLATNAAVREEIQQYVDKANATVSRAESVRKFAVLDTQFTQENKCLTPSLKVVRPAVNRVFADVIDNEIYNGKR